MSQLAAMFVAFLPAAAIVADSASQQLPAGDVRLFGAKCDGVSNDTPAIQAAITAGYKHIIIPQGTCIIAPPAVDKILDVPSGTSLWVQGEGIGISVLQVKAHAGDYAVVFGPKWAIWPSFAITDLTLDQNSSNNPVSNTIKDYGRLLLASGGGNSLLVDHLEVRNINCRQVIMSTTPNTTVSNSRFVGVGGGSVYHDSSIVYLASDDATVTGNIFRSAGSNSAGAVAAIETHGGRHTITGNVIEGFEIGMNITGVEAIETNGVTVTGNVISDAYYGIDLWSIAYRAHTSGYGLSGVVIANNTIHLKRSAWHVNSVTGGPLPGNSAGIFVNASSDLPLRAISITGNVVEWDRQDANLPADSTSMGIGYWDATNRNRIEDLVIKDNLISGAPMAAIYLGVDGRSFDISSNTILNPATSVAPSIFLGFKSGIFLGNIGNIDGTVRISDNHIDASLPSAHMAHGIYATSKGKATLLATGDVISFAGANRGDFLGAFDVSGEGVVVYLSVTQLGRPLTLKQLPTGRVTSGSSMIDAATGDTWVASAGGRVWKKADCATGCLANGARQ